MQRLVSSAAKRSQRATEARASDAKKRSCSDKGAHDSRVSIRWDRKRVAGVGRTIWIRHLLSWCLEVCLECSNKNRIDRTCVCDTACVGISSSLKIINTYVKLCSYKYIHSLNTSDCIAENPTLNGSLTGPLCMVSILVVYRTSQRLLRVYIYIYTILYI